MLPGLRAGMPVIHRHEPEVFPLILNTMPHIFTDVKVLSRPEVLLKCGVSHLCYEQPSFGHNIAVTAQDVPLEVCLDLPEV